MAKITGKIELNGVESEFYIDGDLGWQQWGPVTREQLGDRVPILDALVAGLADCDEWREEEDEEDEPESATCKVCHERITWDGKEWVHFDGDMYCGTGDGAMALPEDEEDESIDYKW